jgi:hypothetical protein
MLSKIFDESCEQSNEKKLVWPSDEMIIVIRAIEKMILEGKIFVN